MVDQINQAVDVVIPCMDEADGAEDEDETIINISGYGTNTRPLYLIKRKKDIELIRKHLSVKKRVLLRTFNTNAYYSCETTEIEQKVRKHMASTGAYLLIVELDSTNRDYLDTHLNNVDERISCTLNDLLHHQSITFSQWQQMKVERLASRLDSLYFLPDTRRVRHTVDLSLYLFPLNIGPCSIAANAELLPWFNIQDFSFSHSSSSAHL